MFVIYHYELSTSSTGGAVMTKPVSERGTIELLSEKHYNATNDWGDPVVGWRPTTQGEGLVNKRGYALLRVVVGKIACGIRTFLHDQLIFVQNAGVFVIIQEGDRIALIKNFRFVGERILPNAGGTYVKRLDEERLWDKLLGSLGKWRHEAPRGLAPGSTEEGFEEFLLRSAELEAREEAGVLIKNARIVGRVNPDPSFYAHAQYVVLAEVESRIEQGPENLEMIGGVEFLTLTELRELNMKGEFDDGPTLSAIALCGLTIPPP